SINARVSCVPTNPVTPVTVMFMPMAVSAELERKLAASGRSPNLAAFVLNPGELPGTALHYLGIASLAGGIAEPDVDVRCLGPSSFGRQEREGPAGQCYREAPIGVHRPFESSLQFRECLPAYG